jgi:hypothetical protein
MFKKLLVAVLALTMMIGLFSPALATNTKTGVVALEQQLPRIDRGARSSPGCTAEFDEYYYGGYNYIWGLPDSYGDEFFNMRFTNGVTMELQAVEFMFIKRATASGSNPVPNTVGGMGVTIYVWKSQADGFPDVNQVIYSVPINPVVWGNPYGLPASYTSVQAAIPDMPGFQGDFNVGYSPIQNTDPGQRLYLLSDAGQVSAGRSSEGWMLDPGPPLDYGWGTMLADYGLDAGFCIDAYKCAIPDPPCDLGANATDQWPIWCHDYGRSSQTGIALGTDICGIRNAWTYDIGTVGGVLQIARTTPLIVDNKAYVVYTDRVVCLNLLTGIPIWDSKTLPWGAAVSGLLSDPAIDGGYLYLGTGAQVAPGPTFNGNPGFMRVDATTGALGWIRGAGLGAPLESGAGPTTVSPPVIIGDQLYFGNQGGVLYALDKNTGATLYYSTLPTEAGNTAKMLGSLSSDGTNLFVGTANVATVSPAAGRVYSFLPGVGVGAGFTQNWVYDQPAAVQTAYPGGFFSAPSYRCGNLFIQSIASYNATTGYCGYRQDLDPVTGAQKWFADVAMGAARQAPPATIGGPAGPTAVFANMQVLNYRGDVSTRGIRAVNTYNTTVWANNGGVDWMNNVIVHTTVTQDPWVFYGACDLPGYSTNPDHPGGAYWKITNGTTGAIFAQYAFSGPVNGTAIAHGSDGNDWILVTTQLQRTSTGAVSGSGLVLAFRDMGDRSRLIVPTNYVQFNSTDDAEVPPVQRTATGAITNIGCADMTWTGVLDNGAVVAKIRTVSLAGQQKAADLAASLIDRKVEDLTPLNEPKTSVIFANSLVPNEESDLSATQVKPAVANSARLATPDWVSWADPVSGTGTVVAGASADFTFQFDLTKMKKLGANVFYVEISTNDPDYNPEILPANPQGVQAEIAYDMPYRYCAILVDSTLKFGNTGKAWTNNVGLLGHMSYKNAFDLTGAAADHLFQGSMFYANSMPNAAWEPVSAQGTTTGYDPFIDGGFLFGFYPTGSDCGGCVKNTALPVDYTTDGVTYNSLLGDICTFAMVDSGQAKGLVVGAGNNNQGTHQVGGASMGILVQSKDITAYGSAFGNFKLTVQTITNRNATPITGLYYGSLMDWDILAADDNYGDADKGYIYIFAGGQAYGQIGLPSKGSNWPDGTPTDPMYNGRLMHSADNIYPNQQFDSLYDWVAKYAEGSMTKKAPVDVSIYDKAYEVAFGKIDLGANGTPAGEHTFGFASFGIGSGFTGPTDVDNLRKFVNKFAGFGRGDIDNNNVIDLRDLVRLSRYAPAVGSPLGPGPVPFKHTGDVDNSGVVDHADVLYLAAYFFGLPGNTPPKSTFVF